MKKDFDLSKALKGCENLMKCPNIDFKEVFETYTIEVSFKLNYRTKKPLFVKMTLKLGSKVSIEEIYLTCENKLRELLHSKKAYSGSFKLGYLNMRLEEL